MKDKESKIKKEVYSEILLYHGDQPKWAVHAARHLNAAFGPLTYRPLKLSPVRLAKLVTWRSLYSAGVILFSLVIINLIWTKWHSVLGFNFLIETTYLTICSPQDIHLTMILWYHPTMMCYFIVNVPLITCFPNFPPATWINKSWRLSWKMPKHSDLGWSLPASDWHKTPDQGNQQWVINLYWITSLPLPNVKCHSL